MFRRTTVILGVVQIANSGVETVEEISSRLMTALESIEPNRLMVAPDCGLGLLDKQTALAKLDHLVRAAQSIPLGERTLASLAGAREPPTDDRVGLPFPEAHGSTTPRHSSSKVTRISYQTLLT